MTSPNAKYGFGPKTRDGSDTENMRDFGGSYLVAEIGYKTHCWLKSGRYTYNGRQRDGHPLNLIPLSELEQSGDIPVNTATVLTAQGAVVQEAPTVTDRMSPGYPCQSCTGWQGIDTLRCIQCSEWSHQNYVPLSELATCKEALHVQNVSQEDIDSLLGLRKEEASDTLEALESQTAVIEHQQAMLIALVECKDALLKELVELKAQRASYPAKATPEMRAAAVNEYRLAVGSTTIKGEVAAEAALCAALAAATKDDRECGASEYADMANKYNNADRALSRLLIRLGFGDVEYALAEIDGLEDERDELKRQLDVVTNELMALKHTHEKCQYIEHGFVRMVEAAEAKCPPDSVLNALHGLMDRHDFPLFNQQNVTHFMWGALDRIVLSLAKWKASKTEPKEGE